MDTTKPPGIRIAQIFLTKSHFEYTVNPVELPPNTAVGEINTTIEVQLSVDDADNVGVVSVSVSTAPESTGLYRFQVEMTAIVDRVGEPNMPIREYVRSAGPPTIYPFLREAVASLTGKARFGAVWLPPVNFAAIASQIRFPDEKPPIDEKNPTS